MSYLPSNWLLFPFEVRLGLVHFKHKSSPKSAQIGSSLKERNATFTTVKTIEDDYLVIQRFPLTAFGDFYTHHHFAIEIEHLKGSNIDPSACGRNQI